MDNSDEALDKTTSAQVEDKSPTNQQPVNPVDVDASYSDTIRPKR
jgi:hypothetical protein